MSLKPSPPSQRFCHTYVLELCHMTRLVLRGFTGKKYSTYPWSQDSDRLGLLGLIWILPPITNPPDLSSTIGSLGVGLS